MSDITRRVLVVDDNSAIHADFSKIFNGLAPVPRALEAATEELFGSDGNKETVSYELEFAFQGQEGLELVRSAIARQQPYAMAFLDVQMPPGWDGVETMSRIWEIAPDLQIVLCTAYSTYELRDIIARVGRSDRFVVLKKPFDSIEVLQLANVFSEKWRLHVDVTERKRTEEKLRLQNSALVAAANGIMITDQSGRILWINPAFTQLTGYTAEDAVGQTSALFKPGADSAGFYKNLWTTVLAGKVWQGEMINRRKDGSTYCEEMTVTPVLDEHGAIKNFVAVKQDISRRKRSEEQLREREEAFRALADNVPDAVARLDRNLRFAYGNRALARELDREPAAFLGKTVEELNLPQHGQWTKEIRRVFETGTGYSFEFNWSSPDGICYRESRLVPECSPAGEVEFVLVVTRDVTEQKRAERERQMMDLQLRQAQKMEAVGQLAAGIAHEINTPTQYVGDNARFLKDAFQNILAMLQGYSEMIAAARQNTITPELIARAEETVSSGDLDYHFQQIPAAINETLEGVERVSKIVRAMKEFSHPGSTEKVAVDINKAIDSTVTVARNEWKYIADVVLDLDANLPPVPCFVGEFNQAILNLVVNATHAIADVVRLDPSRKGRINIKTRRDGDYAEVRVSDTGTGIKEEHRHRIFEPFFTTKDVGKGTGQGLTLVYSSVVKKHGGTIMFETEVGKGTTFIIRLPLTLKPPAGTVAETRAAVSQK